jgi:hypothetical protein
LGAAPARVKDRLQAATTTTTKRSTAMDEGALNASAIPIIDFGPFLDGSNKHEVAGKMVSSFKEIGFVYLMNHGIPTEKSAEMFEWVGIDVLSVRYQMNYGSLSPRDFLRNLWRLRSWRLIRRLGHITEVSCATVAQLELS